MGTAIDQSKRSPGFDLKFWGLSILSMIPWTVKVNDPIRSPTTINRRLRSRAQSKAVPNLDSRRDDRLRFRPYISKVPWHTGPRAFLSMLFPRYGHYCGPNWSSGKAAGTLLWDRRPIDWLDYCCYCHDIGYDTHDQSKLLEADLAFLECLEKPFMIPKDDANIAHLYRAMCITGMKNILIPYRMQLVKLQSENPLLNFGWVSNVKWMTNKSKKPFKWLEWPFQ